MPVTTADRPVHVAFPPGDPTRMLVVENRGPIRVFRDGALLAEPFLDLSEGLHTAGEGGVLSLAFAPDYADSGRFYTFRTGTDLHAYVEEFTRSAASADRADPASRRLVLRIPHTGGDTHWGGLLAFGPDGLLYVSVGDGGGAYDPGENAESLGTLLGKLLRIDPRPLDGAEYRIPPDNPFAATAGARPEIYAYGLRNPWRFSFDRLTGDLVLPDVGQESWEEINFAARGQGAGAFYGWDMFEGPAPVEVGTAGPHVAPVHAYPHPDGCASITGGYVARDPALPSLAGRYLYTDLCAGVIRSIRLAPGSASDDAATELSLRLPVSFGEDLGGCLYVVSLQGGIYRIAEAPFTPVPCAPPPPPPPPDTKPPDTLLDAGPSGLVRARVASFAFRADEDGAAFECAWDGSAFSGCASPAQAAGLADGPHTFAVRAVDAAGNADASPATRAWAVDATPPETSIVRGPAARTTQRAVVLELASSEAGGSFLCAVDGAPEAACASPLEFAYAGERRRVVSARAVDAAGNADETPATHAWLVDLDPLRLASARAVARRLERALRRGGLRALDAGRSVQLDLAPAAHGLVTVRLRRGAQLVATGRVVAEGGSSVRLALRPRPFRLDGAPARTTLTVAFARRAGVAGATARRVFVSR